MALPWQDSPVRYREVDVERDVPSRMRDGTLLYADIYRPKGEGPWPVLLLRHPYHKTQSQMLSYAHPSWYARYGYMVVAQDVRGRWTSEGEWYPFKYEEDDGCDTITWAAELPGTVNFRRVFVGQKLADIRVLLPGLGRRQIIAMLSLELGLVLRILE